MPCLKVVLAVSVLVYCKLFAAEGQNFSEVDPSVYPYLVKLIVMPNEEFEITEVGLMVSRQYILTSNNDVRWSNPSDISVIDQLGNPHRAAKVVGIVNNTFFYLKVCVKMEGEKFWLNESIFNDLSADTPNAELLFFDYDSEHTLKRFSNITVMSKDNCAAAFNQSISDTDVCIYNLEDAYPEFCTAFFIDGLLAGAHFRYPVIAINGQVHPFDLLTGLICRFYNTMEEILKKGEEEGRPIGQANLGFFKTDAQINNANDIFVLVVHYGFESHNIARKGNSLDVQNLKTSFDPPDVFIFFVLSHGYEDGKIYTDHLLEDQKTLDHFTTDEIFESIKKLTKFEKSLKLINFGVGSGLNFMNSVAQRKYSNFQPCRGPLADSKFKNNEDELKETYRNRNSCRITLMPAIHNLVVFYSTVETTLANASERGSWLVLKYCDCLNQTEEKPLLTFLSTVQNNVHFASRAMTNLKTGESQGQTPEIKMFAQDREFFISRSLIAPVAYQSTDGKMVRPGSNTKYSETFAWESDEGQNVRGRNAFILFEQQCLEVQELVKSVRNLDFETRSFQLNKLSLNTYLKICSELEHDVGCILTCMFGEVSANDAKEVCILVDRTKMPITDILHSFVGPKNAKWIGKPKIFVLINQDALESDTLLPERKFDISATNHSGWLVLILIDKDDIKSWIEEKKAVVFFDGFDEICPILRENVITLFHALKERQVPMFIATRPHEAEIIKERINCEVLVGVEPLNEEKQIEFLKVVAGKNEEEGKQFISDFEEKDILENPLHLSMLASSKSEGNLYQIYAKVVEKKLELCLVRDGYNIDDRSNFRLKIALALRNLQLIALRFLRNDESLIGHGISKEDLEKMNDYGVATVLDGEVTFLHQTFAEFLATKQFLNDFNSSQALHSSLFQDDTFVQCRKFLDLFYCTLEKEDLRDHTEALFTVAKSIGPVIFLKKVVEDNLRQALQLAIVSNNLKVAEDLINNGADLTVRDKKGRHILQHALKHIEMLKFLHEKNSDLVKQVTKDGSTYLHIAIENNDCPFEVILWLIVEIKIDLNATNEFGETAFMIACSKNRSDVVEYLLANKDIDLSKEDIGGRTALHHATRSGCVDLVQNLLHHGADLTKKDKDNRNVMFYGLKRKEMILYLYKKNMAFVKLVDWKRTNLLLYAIEFSYIVDGDVVHWLIEESGIDLNAVDKKGNSAITLACKKKMWDTVDTLLTKDVNVLAKDGKGKNLLHYAAELGNLNLVQKLVERGVNPTLKDNLGMNAIHYALQQLDLVKSFGISLVKEVTKDNNTSLHLAIGMCEYSIEVIRWLLDEAKLDVNSKNAKGETPLMIACSKNTFDVIRILLDNEADVSNQDNKGRTALHHAARSGHLDLIKQLFDLLALKEVEDGSLNIHQTDKEENTLLILAMKSRKELDEKAISWLVEDIKLDLNAVNSNGESALLLACKHNKWDVVDILLSREDIDIGSEDQKERTALHWAAASGNLDVVRRLVERGADLTLKDSDGMNVMHHALKDVETVKFLHKLNKGLVKEVTKNGSTCLHLAVIRGLTEVIRWLVGDEIKADLDKSNELGLTALLLACRRNMWEVVELLVDNNVDIGKPDRAGVSWDTLGQDFWGGVFQSAWHESLEVDPVDGSFLDRKTKTDQDFEPLLTETERKECLVLATASSVQKLQQYVQTCEIKIPKKLKRLDFSDASGTEQQQENTQFRSDGSHQQTTNKDNPIPSQGSEQSKIVSAGANQPDNPEIETIESSEFPEKDETGETHNQIKRVANLGFFECELDGLVTRTNADNVCVLVIHYEFKNNPNLFRSGDTCDVENLKTSFGENRNCYFRNMSPNKETLLQLLGDQVKLLQHFNTKDDVPSVFVLFILSHGTENGRIATDYIDKKTNDYERFTTDEVLDSLQKLDRFDNCLKIVNFGPCRGALEDSKFDINKSYEGYENRNSCRITTRPGMQNFAVFYSTVETTMANTDTKGSWFVRHICLCLNNNNDESSLLTFFTTVQSQMHQTSRDYRTFASTRLGQTPELKLFTQDRKFIISKTKKTAIPIPKTDAVRDRSKIKTKPFSANFPWKSDEEQDIRGRRGFILSVVRSKQVQEMTRVLQNLDFEIREWKLNDQSVKLYTEIVSELEPDVGAIITCIFGPVCENKQKEVSVRVQKGKEIPISEILYSLVGPKNNKLIGKPKIMFVVDVEAPQTDDMPVHTKDLQVSATNHSGWLVLILKYEDASEKLIELLGKIGEKSLQELLEPLLTRELKKGDVVLLNSTLQYLIQFPSWPRIFVEPDFKLNIAKIPRQQMVRFKNSMKSYVEEKIDFETLLKYAIQSFEKNKIMIANLLENTSSSHDFGPSTKSNSIIHYEAMSSAKNSDEPSIIWLLSSVAGAGKSTVIKELAHQLSKYDGFKILRIPLKDKYQIIRDMPFKVDANRFLADATFNCHDDIIDWIEKRELIVFLDGFDEVCPDFREKIIKIMFALNSARVPHFIGTRPHEVHHIQERIINSTKVDIEPLNRAKQIVFLKTVCRKDRQEIKQLRKNFKNKGIMGNPLYLTLLADSKGKENLYDIFDTIVREKVKICLKRENGGKDVGEEMIDKSLQLIQLVASRYVRGMKIDQGRVSKEDLKKINAFGVVIYFNDKVHFTHQMFAEFLTAQKFIKDLKNPSDEEVPLFLDELMQCRKFVDLFFSTKNDKDASNAEAFVDWAKPTKLTEPLNLVRQICREDLRQMFMLLKPDLSLKDEDGKNALHFALRHLEMVKMVHEKSSRLATETTNDGENCLHLAIADDKCSEEVALWIMENTEADKNAETKINDTPLLLAVLMENRFCTMPPVPTNQT
ncbi:Hypothetical predicted protein [Cloeon dipterum]|uniref:Caspase family p20 domain-containing protein n=1 Tax=Cloeon dipterum TaxID=197152 RepID=A0A8S1E3R1_9INSE|nr:Hypothetical predicted protein [Cloeon dipterum]